MDIQEWNRAEKQMQAELDAYLSEFPEHQKLQAANRWFVSQLAGLVVLTQQHASKLKDL